MKRNLCIVSLVIICMISTALAFNPVGFVPTDTDFALDIAYPKAVMALTGVEDELLAGLSELAFINSPIDDARLILFGTAGLTDLLIEELEYFDAGDLDELFDSPELLLSLSMMPVALLTNLINLDFILDFLEGEFMESAVDNGVYFVIEEIQKGGYDTKHIRIRYYADSPNVCFDLYFTRLEDDYFLFASDENLLDKSIKASLENTSEKLSSEATDEEDVFVKVTNRGINFSWIALRLLDVFDGKPVSESLAVGMNLEEIFAEINIGMSYPGESYKDVLEKTKTDFDHFNYLPDFEDASLFISLPQTGLSLKTLLMAFSEITGDNSFGYTLEDILEIPASFGPEVERYNMYLMGEQMTPYLLLKLEDTHLVFENYVKQNELENASVGTITFAYLDGLYIACDSRYDYIEVYDYDLSEEMLNAGNLFFTQEMDKKKETVRPVSDHLWGMLMYEDIFSIVMAYDESADLNTKMTLNIAALEELSEFGDFDDMMSMGGEDEQLENIVDVYFDIAYKIQDDIYYAPDEQVDLSAVFDSYLIDYYDEALLDQFKLSAGKTQDGFTYHVYYDGDLPEGVSLLQLYDRVEYNNYDESIELDIKSDKVVLKVYQ